MGTTVTVTETRIIPDQLSGAESDPQCHVLSRPDHDEPGASLTSWPPARAVSTRHWRTYGRASRSFGSTVTPSSCQQTQLVRRESGGTIVALGIIMGGEEIEMNAQIRVGSIFF